MTQTNVVRLPQQSQALPPPGARERYKLYPTISEAAIIWSGLSFDVLEGCEHSAPGIPAVPGLPEVAARAQALLDATDHGDLACTKHYRPGVVAGEPAEIPVEIVERRTVARKDLVAWIAGNFPGDLPGSGTQAMPEVPEVPVAHDVLLPRAAVLERVGLSRATLYRKLNDGSFPQPTHTEPTHRWLSSVIDAYVSASTKQTGADI